MEDDLARRRAEESNLLQLLQRPAADNFAASCPNPGALQRCEAAPRLDRYNLVVPADAAPQNAPPTAPPAARE